MSARLQDKAVFEASLRGAIVRQMFHNVPPIPPHINLDKKTAIVTGSSTGLGLECARQFLQKGLEHLILAVRSQSKGDTASKLLQADFPQAKIEIWLLDMESEASVRRFAARCQDLDRLDIAILNAGCGKLAFQRCNEGKKREITLQVNYLSTVLLAILLIPILKAKARTLPGRLTLVGSDMAFWAKMEQESGSILDTLDKEPGYDGMAQYGKTKLLLAMAVSKLPDLVSADDVIINLVNPSGVRGTELMRDSKGQYLVQAFVYLSGIFLGRNLVDGTRQYLYSSLVLGKESHGSWTDFKIRP